MEQQHTLLHNTHHLRNHSWLILRCGRASENTVWHKYWCTGVRNRVTQWKYTWREKGRKNLAPRHDVGTFSWPHYPAFENKQAGQTLIIYGFNTSISGSINALWAIHNPRIPDLNPGVSLVCFYFRNAALFFCFALLLKPLKINPCCQMLSVKAQSVVLLVGFLMIIFICSAERKISYGRCEADKTV